MKKTKRGFTLVELIIVIAVIGVLAAILIPVFSNVIDKANAKSALSDGRNTVEQYIIDAMENRGLPKNVLVFVKKANNMYIYGYGMESDGTLKKARDGEAYKKYSDPTQLMSEFSFNEKHPGVTPDLTGATKYDEAADGSFWLVPYANGIPTVEEDPHGIAIKGFHGVKDVDMSKYPELSDQMTEKMGDDVWVYHGYLLNGTYSLDNGEGGTSGGGGDTPIVTPAPVVKHTITFEKGGSGLDGFDASKVTVPAPVEVEEGSKLIPMSYQASYDFDPDTEDGFLFDGWDVKDSTDVTGDMTLTAQWTAKKLEKYTLTFNANGGDLKLASGVTSGMKVVKDTNITSFVLDSSASKANTKFQGWNADNGEFYAPDHTGAIMMTRDITLTAQFDDIKYDVIFKAGEGTGSDYKMDPCKVGTTITLPTAAEAGFTAPSGKVFGHWQSSIADEPPVGAGGEYKVTEAVTFTAVWKLGGTEVTVKFYDTWNEQTITADSKVRVSGTTVNYSQVASVAPEYWVQGSTVTVSIVDDTVTFTGTRKATTSAANDALNPTYTTYLGSGVEYQCLTTTKGLHKTYSNLTTNYLVLNDIEFGTSQGGVNWTPIGNTTTQYTGVFDGGNHVLNQLYCSNTSASYLGMFGVIGEGAVVKNMTINVNLVNANTYAGGAVALNNGSVLNVHVQEAAVADGEDAPYIQCVNASASIHLGGFVGRNDGTVKFCSSNLDDTCGDYDFQGGFVGSNFGTIDQCWSVTCVNASYYSNIHWDFAGQKVGGFVGGNAGTITNSFVNVDMVCGDTQVGGFAGYMQAGSKIENCWCYCDSMLADGTKDPTYRGEDIGYLKGGTSQNNILVHNNATAKQGWTLKTADQFEALTSFASWDASIWDFTAGSLKLLKNNPYTV